jgi:predicted glutamine amidotransferase
MCRWMAWLGQPVAIHELLFESPHGIVDQSLHSRMGADSPRLARLTSGDRIIASEPFADLPGLWHEIAESSAVIVRRGGVLEHESFRPQHSAGIGVPAVAEP